MGFIFSLLGFLLGLEIVIERFTDPTLPRGYATLIAVISIFSGVQLIAIGMVGEYIGRVFVSQGKKPQYTVRKKFE